MELVQVLGAEAIRFLTVKSAYGQSIHGMSFRKLVEHFKFMDGPKDVASLNLSQGITFNNGLFRGKVVIDQLKIHDDGVLAQCKDSTDDCDGIIAELVEIGTECGLIFEALRETAYFSALVTKLDMSFDERFRILEPVMSALNSSMRDAKLLSDEFEAFGIQLWANKSKRPHFFRLEKRVDNPGAYFSSAPMRTSDHLEMLRRIEAIV